METRSEIKMCNAHGEYEAKIFLIGPHRSLHQPCPNCEREKKAAEEARKRVIAAENEQRKIERALRAAAIPPRFENCTFENYLLEDGHEQTRAHAIMKRYANNFAGRREEGGGLVLCGRVGTGKTHLAVAIAREIIGGGYTALFTSVRKATKAVKSTWGSEASSSERDAIEAFIKPDLLIIDEIGVQFGSETEKMIIYEIINGRYENIRPTIIMSNLSESELSAYIGDRVLDRMREGGGAILAMNWTSYRAKVHKDGVIRFRKSMRRDFGRELGDTGKTRLKSEPGPHESDWYTVYSNSGKG